MDTVDEAPSASTVEEARGDDGHVSGGCAKDPYERVKDVRCGAQDGVHFPWRIHPTRGNRPNNRRLPRQQRLQDGGGGVEAKDDGFLVAGEVRAHRFSALVRPLEEDMPQEGDGE